MIGARIITLILSLLILGCDQAPKAWVIHLDPQGQLTSDEMKNLFDARLRYFQESRMGTIVYRDMVGIRVGVVAGEGELARLTQSLAEVISNRGYGPVGTGWHEGVPDTADLPSTEKRFVQIRDLTDLGRAEGFDRKELGEILRYVNWGGGELMSEEDIGNYVVSNGNLKDFATLTFSTRKPYTITTGEQDGADQPATAPESKAEGEEKPKTESDGRSQ